MSRSGAAPDLRGPGVGLETLLPGEPRHILDQVEVGGRVRPNPCAHPKKVQDGKPAPCSGGAARRKDMVGPHTIVPEHLRCTLTDEEGAVVMESIRPGFGVRHRELQVLGGDVVAG